MCFQPHAVGVSHAPLSEDLLDEHHFFGESSVGSECALSTAAAAVCTRASGAFGPGALVVAERIQASDEVRQREALVDGGDDVDGTDWAIKF